MSSERNDRIEELLREEVARRGLGASIAFSFLSIMIFFYHFKTVHMTPYIRASALLMLIAAILRLRSSRSFISAPAESHWKLMQAAIWINSFSWAVIFGLAGYELQNEGLHFVVLVTMMAGALSGSLVTLSNSPTLYMPFMISCIVPLFANAFVSWWNRNNDAGIYLMISYAIFAIYQTMQFRKVREMQIEKLTTQVDLESSLRKLETSQDAFVKQTAKLFHASKLSALGEMAGGLSHEVNNSLMTIMGSIEQLDRYLQRDGVEAPEYRRKIQTSKDAIHQIKTVIDGLRFFSQQGDDAEKADRPLEEIIHRTLNFCNEMIKANNITMIVAPIPPVMVHCNPMQITQILFYVTKNAFDALEEVSDPMKRWIRISFVERDQEIEIRVMNGGPQMNPAVKSRLFQPFFTTKEVGKGTGLSLSISKGIAQANAGDIYLDDTSDCTTFALKIPSAPLAGGAHA